MSHKKPAIFRFSCILNKKIESLKSGDLTARQKAELILEKELAQVEAEKAKNEAAKVGGLELTKRFTIIR